ncbi:MAG TPA: hypothetical protein VGE07_07325 [Herpetosiphonaceae bacterium]
MSQPRIPIATMLAVITLSVIITYRQRHRPPAWAAGGPRSAGGCLSFILGLVLIGAALALGVPATLDAERALDTARATPPIRQLTPDLIGKAALIEGAVSPQNPIAAWGAVAFERFAAEQRPAVKGVTWRLAERHAPPLTLVTSGQPVQIEHPADAGSGYDIAGAPLLPGRERVYGLGPGDRVLATGTVRQWARGLYLDADEIRAGDYAAYLAERADFMARHGRLAVAAFAGCGLALLIVALLPADWRPRQPSNQAQQDP